MASDCPTIRMKVLQCNCQVVGRLLHFMLEWNAFLVSKLFKGCLKCFYTVDCKWNEWNSWSVCSKTCDTGSRNRTRTKTDGSVGGLECSGDAVENQPCNTDECPGMKNV